MADQSNTIYIEHLEITKEERLADEKLQEDVEQQGLVKKFVAYQEATTSTLNSIKRGSETTEHGGNINSSIMLFTPLLQQPHKLAPEKLVELSPYQSLKPPLQKVTLQQSTHHQPIQQSHQQPVEQSPQQPVELLLQPVKQSRQQPVEQPPQQLVKLSHQQPVEQSSQQLVIQSPQQPVALLPQSVEQSHQQLVKLSPQQPVELLRQQQIEQSHQQLIKLSQQPVELLPEQSVEQSPQHLINCTPQQPIELLRQQQIELSPQQPVQLSHHQSSKLLLKQSYQPTSTNQPQVLGTSETCSRHNSTDSINYYSNSGQESGDPNPMEVVVTQVIKISNIIDMNRYYHTSHTTTELSSNYYELP